MPLKRVDKVDPKDDPLYQQYLRQNLLGTMMDIRAREAEFKGDQSPTRYRSIDRYARERGLVPTTGTRESSEQYNIKYGTVPAKELRKMMGETEDKGVREDLATELRRRSAISEAIASEPELDESTPTGGGMIAPMNEERVKANIEQHLHERQANIREYAKQFPGARWNYQDPAGRFANPNMAPGGLPAPTDGSPQFEEQGFGYPGRFARPELTGGEQAPMLSEPQTGTRPDIVGQEGTAQLEGRTVPLPGVRMEDVPSSGGSPGSRDFGGARGGGRHAGLDMPGKVGTSVVAPMSGSVLKIGFDHKGYGNFIDMKATDGTIHRMAHLKDVASGLQPGSPITERQTMGRVGFTGNATENFPHLHYEVFPNQKNYDLAQGRSSRESYNLRIDPRAYHGASNTGDIIARKPSDPAPARSYNPVVTDVSKRYNLDPAYVDRVIQIESGGKANAQDKGSSYKGLLQMSDEEFNRYSPKGGNIWNPRDNAEAWARKTSAEGQRFAKDYGREPTHVERYLLHQQGEAGLRAHLNNPNGKAVDNIREFYKKTPGRAEQAILKNSGSLNDTSQQFMDRWNTKLGIRPTVATGTKPPEVSPEQGKPAIAQAQSVVIEAPPEQAQAAPGAQPAPETAPEAAPPEPFYDPMSGAKLPGAPAAKQPVVTPQTPKQVAPITPESGAAEPTPTIAQTATTPPALLGGRGGIGSDAVATPLQQPQVPGVASAAPPTTLPGSVLTTVPPGAAPPEGETDAFANPEQPAPGTEPAAPDTQFTDYSGGGAPGGGSGLADSGGGGNGLFGDFGLGGGKGGGGKGGGFQNQVQLPNMPDLGQQLLKVADEKSDAPTSLSHLKLPTPPQPMMKTPQEMGDSYVGWLWRKQQGLA